MLRRAALTTCYLATAAGLCLTVGAAEVPVPRTQPRVLPGVEQLAQAGKAKAPAASESTKDDLNDLSQQVEALLTLYYLNVNRGQLKALIPIAKETAAKPRDRKPARASAAFRTTLTNLRAALAKNDAEQVAELADKLDELRETEKTEFDDEFEVTAEARKQAPEVVRRLGVNQMLAYVANFEDDLFDPLERITDAIADGRVLKAQEWQELRDSVAGDVGRVVGGLNKEKADKVREAVGELLDKSRLLKADELKDQQEELDKSARQLVGNLGPTELLRNSMELAIAELLSNPQLPEVLEARLQRK